MRPAAIAGLVLAMLPAAGTAQNAPYLGVVADAEVVLRAGPSDKFPDTGTLPRGAKLVVEGEEAGWLRVLAPHGSVSWVPIAFVEFDPGRPVPQNVLVAAEVTLAPGKVGLPQPLQEIRKAKVPEGTILTVIGQKVSFDNKQWYPVAPPPGDYRYVPKSAVQAGEPLNTSFVVRDTAPPGLTPAAATAGGAGALPDAAPPKPGVNHPLWAQAEAAERDGRLDDAEKLFFQLARVMNEPGGDHDIANLCYTRIHTLREKRRGGSATPSLPPAAGPRRDTVVTRPEPPRDSRPTLLPPVRNDPPAPAATTTPSPDRPGWTGTGRLVSTPVVLDGRQTYALESSPGVPRLYVVAGPGVDLRPYVNRVVNLYGTTHTHPNTKKLYVVATEVNPNP